MKFRIALSAIALVAMAGVQAQQANMGIPPLSLTQPSYSFDTAEQHALKVSVVARGLNHPFAIALLPEGDALISERGGALRLLRNAVGAPGRQNVLETQPVAGLPTLEKPYRNAGLHDLALHPDYAKNHLVYFSFNKAGDLTPASGNTPALLKLKCTRWFFA
jgi:aldose sugar dehydrogenase